jgi:hypothetical protein
MLSREHLELRTQLYDALAVYHEAQGAYWKALRLGQPQQREINTVRATGAALDAALTKLLDCLQQQESNPQAEGEIQREQKLQDILARELALLPATQIEADQRAAPDRPEDLSR